VSRKTLNITIDELSEESQKLSGDFDNTLSGVFVQNITPDFRRNLSIPKRVQGVIIADIKEDSRVDGLLRKNDIIMEANKKQIKNTKDYDAIVSKIKPDEDILLLISRKGSIFYVTLSGK
jgi:S1-C subfamily serine protease